MIRPGIITWLLTSFAVTTIGLVLITGRAVLAQSFDSYDAGTADHADASADEVDVDAGSTFCANGSAARTSCRTFTGSVLEYAIECGAGQAAWASCNKRTAWCSKASKDTHCSRADAEDKEKVNKISCSAERPMAVCSFLGDQNCECRAMSVAPDAGHGPPGD